MKAFSFFGNVYTDKKWPLLCGRETFKRLWKRCVSGIKGRAAPHWVWSLAGSWSPGRPPARSRKVRTKKEPTDTSRRSAGSCCHPSPPFLHYQWSRSQVMPRARPSSFRLVMTKRVKIKKPVGKDIGKKKTHTHTQGIHQLVLVFQYCVKWAITPQFHKQHGINYFIGCFCQIKSCTFLRFTVVSKQLI